jgi:predicted glutamine amidotransferase
MCGIIGIFHAGERKETVNEIALNQFEDQHSRGMQGFGIIKINDDKTIKIDRATEGYKFLYDIHQDPVHGIIVHHRNPTSTENKIKQTHPIIVNNGSLQYKYAVVHNGTISNDDELKEEHEKLGFIYTTEDKKEALAEFNDSESLAIEVARFIEDQTKRIETIGSAAFICLQIDKKTNKATKIFFGRNTSPLKMAKTRGKLFLSSEGQGSDIESETLYECNLDEEMKLSKWEMNFKEEPITTPVYYGGGYTITGFEDRAIDIKKRRWHLDSEKKDTNVCGKIYPVSPGDDDEAEEELTEVDKIVDKRSMDISETLESFYEMLYDEKSINWIEAKDADWVLTEIKESLTKMIEEAKTAYLQEMEANSDLPPAGLCS